MKVEPYKECLPLSNKLRRLWWGMVYVILFRPFGGPLFRRWRVLVLRSFGAAIGERCAISASARIWAPWNLSVGDVVAIGPHTNIYNPGKIMIGNKVTISQDATLCTASHDFTLAANPLITSPVQIGSFAWIAAEAFVGMGVTIGEGAIVGARAAVFKNVEPWSIVGGNPAKFIKKRVIKDA
ncbi:MAG: putative colanic acid biosynthesis acetyltransferase [Prevotellaceae bacterium]|nr:putative colanic acid biosynthesis acetyltransferase [Prevotellaceae bacterium]